MRLWIWLVLLASVAGIALKEVDWTAQNRKTYCNMISHRRIYKQQRLEWYCQLKVRKVDDQVQFKLVFCYFHLKQICNFTLKV